MADEFRFTCSEGHSWVSSNKIRSFCPECGKSTRRVTSEPKTDDTAPKQPKNLTIKHVKVAPKPTPPPHKEPIVATRKPPPKPAPKAPSRPLTQKKAPARKNPVVAKKFPKTTAKTVKSAPDDTMFTRMRKAAFGR